MTSSFVQNVKNALTQLNFLKSIHRQNTGRRKEESIKQTENSNVFRAMKLFLTLTRWPNTTLNFTEFREILVLFVGNTWKGLLWGTILRRFTTLTMQGGYLSRINFLTNCFSRKYTCEECGKVYKTKTDLDTHLTKHSGDKLYTCPTCGKSFRFWNGLDDCMRRHNSDMRYKCNWQVMIPS